MKNKEKDLLLKDLLARLPYGVVIKEEYGDYINVNIHNANIEHLIDRILAGVDKLVLRPMSDMTDEEKEEIRCRWCYEWSNETNEDYAALVNHYQIDFGNVEYYVDWLNEHYLDYRGLIPMGLALPLPEGMYETKSE